MLLSLVVRTLADDLGHRHRLDPGDLRRTGGHGPERGLPDGHASRLEELGQHRGSCWAGSAAEATGTNDEAVVHQQGAERTTFQRRPVAVGPGGHRRTAS